MKEEGKNFYETPSITVVEVKAERVVCQSGNLQNYNWNEYQEE